MSSGAPFDPDAAAQVRQLRDRIERVDDDALDLLFKQARTASFFRDDAPVSDDLLRRLAELAMLGPTSVNCQPARFTFVRSPEAKARLIPALKPGNVAKVQSAPVTAIVAYDVRFFEHLPRVFPHKDVAEEFRASQELTHETAFRNGTLQGAYLMLAARALGLDVGPISGFSAAIVDQIFFEGSSLRCNFLCNLGHGDPDRLFGRQPRMAVDDVCSLV